MCYSRSTYADDDVGVCKNDRVIVPANCHTSVDLIEEVDELFKIYFVVRFRACYLDHCCTWIRKVTSAFEDRALPLTLNIFVFHCLSQEREHTFQVLRIDVSFPATNDSHSC